ncbi:T-complex protein 11 X-linked protein 2 [Manis javanica]|nr:T-complex protein 11 X-linked protein 2 [Manis javanica]
MLSFTSQWTYVLLQCRLVCNTQKSRVDFPGGITVTEEELAKLGWKFPNLMHPNQQVFSPYYAEILKKYYPISSGTGNTSGVYLIVLAPDLDNRNREERAQHVAGMPSPVAGRADSLPHDIQDAGPQALQLSITYCEESKIYTTYELFFLVGLYPVAIESMLQFLDPRCIDHLEVDLTHFREVNSVLAQTAHLYSLCVSNIRFTCFAERYFQTFLNCLGKLDNLQELDLFALFLRDRLHRLLRVLPPQLEKLNLSFCGLSNKDVTILSQSSLATHLRQLNLSHNQIFSEAHEPFQTLLERASGSSHLDGPGSHLHCHKKPHLLRTCGPDGARGLRRLEGAAASGRGENEERIKMNHVLD